MEDKPWLYLVFLTKWAFLVRRDPSVSFYLFIYLFSQWLLYLFLKWPVHSSVHFKANGHSLLNQWQPTQGSIIWRRIDFDLKSSLYLFRETSVICYNFIKVSIKGKSYITGTQDMTILTKAKTKILNLSLPSTYIPDKNNIWKTTICKSKTYYQWDDIGFCSKMQDIDRKAFWMIYAQQNTTVHK